VSRALEVTVPDIGDFEDVPVIEILVSVGDTVGPEDPLVTLESDKATMDVPAPFAGTVSALSVSIGDRVSEGSVLLTLESSSDGATADSDEGGSGQEAVSAAVVAEPPPPPRPRRRTAATGTSSRRARLRTGWLHRGVPGGRPGPAGGAGGALWTASAASA